MYLQEILYIHLSIYMNYQQATRWKNEAGGRLLAALAGRLSELAIQWANFLQ